MIYYLYKKYLVNRLKKIKNTDLENKLNTKIIISNDQLLAHRDFFITLLIYHDFICTTTR